MSKTDKLFKEIVGNENSGTISEIESLEAKLEEEKRGKVRKLNLLKKACTIEIEKLTKLWEEEHTKLKFAKEEICRTIGHSYSDWEMRDGFIDRDWYYTRTCMECGKVETVYSEPKEFSEQRAKAKIKKL